MATLPETQTPRNCVAYYAWLNDVPGVVLYDHTGVASFQTEATGMWQTLTAVDAPRLMKLGRCDLVALQAILDGPGYAWIERRNTEHARVAA